MRKFIIIFFVVFFPVSVFSQVADGDLRCVFHKTSFLASNTILALDGIGVELGYDFFPSETKNIGFALGLGCIYSLSDNIETSVRELKINETFNKIRAVNFDIGVSFKQKLERISFREKLLCSFINPYGKINEYIDERDLVFSGLLFAPKVSLSTIFNFTSHFYTICNFAVAYGWGKTYSYIDYTDKDAKSKNQYTTKENSTVFDVSFALGFGFLVY